MTILIYYEDAELGEGLARVEKFSDSDCFAARVRAIRLKERDCKNSNITIVFDDTQLNELFGPENQSFIKELAEK